MMKYQERVDLTHALRQIGVTTPVPGMADWPVFEHDYINFRGPAQFTERAADQLQAWLDQQGYLYERYNLAGIQNIEPRAVLAMCNAFDYCPYWHDSVLLAEVLAEAP